MTFKAEVSLCSRDGKTWTVDRLYYVVSDTRMGNKGMLRLENLDIVENFLKEDDVLVKKQKFCIPLIKIKK